MSCSACGHGLLHSSGRRKAAGVGVGAVAALFTGPFNEGASAEVLNMEDTDVCWSCTGAGMTSCPRCEGTGMMTYLNDPDQKHACSECRESSGWRICGKCTGTGLPAKELKILRRDPAFVKVQQRNLETVLDAEGRRKLKEVLSTAINAARERRAAKAKAKAT